MSVGSWLHQKNYYTSSLEASVLMRYFYTSIGTIWEGRRLMGSRGRKFLVLYLQFRTEEARLDKYFPNDTLSSLYRRIIDEIISPIGYPSKASLSTHSSYTPFSASLRSLSFSLALSLEESKSITVGMIIS